MIRFLISALLLLGWGIALPVSATTTAEFNIRIFGATDTVPPSTPNIISATPVAPSQIDLTWSTSTDNFLVFGYVVARDGVPIATTTATTYSDTSLTASTSYGYTVTAFDGVPNYSTTSAPATATTPGIPVPPTPESNFTQGTVARVVIDDFTLRTGVSTATMEIETAARARLEVRLGLTNSYDQSYYVGNQFRTDHTFLFNDLEPATTYFYELIGYTPSGVQTVLRRGSFTTESDTPPPRPANVRELQLLQDGDAVRISYQLPPNFPTNGYVRVLRNHFGYPAFLSDGLVVYEGTAEAAVDSTAFADQGQVYYTVFVVNPNGLISSGAIATLRDGRLPPVSDAESETEPGWANPTTPGDVGDRPTSTVVDLDGFPNLSDFVVEQGTVRYPFSSSTIALDSDAPFTVSVPSAAITGEFKTLVATLGDPRQPTRTFSFMLRLNAAQTDYEAIISPIRLGGQSRLLVEVFDYDTSVIAAYQTTVAFSEPISATNTEMWLFRVQAWFWLLIAVVPLAVLGMLWWLFAVRRRSDDEDNEPGQGAAD